MSGSDHELADLPHMLHARLLNLRKPAEFSIPHVWQEQHAEQRQALRPSALRLIYTVRGRSMDNLVQTV